MADDRRYLLFLVQCPTVMRNQGFFLTGTEHWRERVQGKKLADWQGSKQTSNETAIDWYLSRFAGIMDFQGYATFSSWRLGEMNTWVALIRWRWYGVWRDSHLTPEKRISPTLAQIFQKNAYLESEWNSNYVHFSRKFQHIFYFKYNSS